MAASPVFVWLHATPFAIAIRQSTVLFPCIECVHVLALTLVVGSISIVDLRLLGVPCAGRSIATVTSEVLPLTWIAFGIAAMSGAALFTSHAVGYAQNLQFQIKFLLLVLAACNMLVFHGIMRRDGERWSNPGATPWEGRVAGLISLLLWIGIVACGRWVGFEAVR